MLLAEQPCDFEALEEGAAAEEALPASAVLARHMPGLDVLRGAAVLAVVLCHGMAFSAPRLVWHNAIAEALYRATAWGWTGVNLFFTLSGFLITGNLLDSLDRENYYARFYLRRALRILPVYALVLLVLGLTHTTSWTYAGVCSIFLANWPTLLLHGKFATYTVLWSLAVEEQFYALWPWLCRRLRGRALPLLCLAMLAICPVLRMWGMAVKAPFTDIFSKPFVIGDNLAIGAALALLCRSPRVSLAGLARLGWAVLGASGFVLLVVTSAGHALKGDVWGAGIGYTAMEWSTGGLLICLLCAYRTRPLHPSLRVLVFLGDISYGLYLVHLLCALLYDHCFGQRYLFDGSALLVRFVVANGLAVVLAALSRRYLEGPILALKRRIPLAA